MAAARTLHAFLPEAGVPERAALQAAIDRLGFDLQLDPGWAPHAAPAYLPCTLEGEDAGVYVRFDREAALPAGTEALAAQRGDRGTGVQLRWGGDAREQLAATLIAAALAEGFDALVVAADGAEMRTLESLQAEARHLHASAF